MRSVNAVISSVFIMAGIIDTFLEVYSHANNSGLILGIPLTSIYPTINIIIPTVINVASIIRRYTAKEPGCRK